MLILQSSKTLKECEISQKFLSYDIIYTYLLRNLSPGNILTIIMLADIQTSVSISVTQLFDTEQRLYLLHSHNVIH